MREAVLSSLEKRLRSYDDLIGSVPAEQLAAKLDVPKHKSLAEHLWCVVGARESYARSLEAGRWEGFGCSMSEFSYQEFADKLSASADDVLAAVAAIGDWTPERERMLVELAEHEVMHEGQIIRHMYALEMEIPESLKWA